MSSWIRRVPVKYKHSILLGMMSILALYFFSVYLNDALEYVRKKSAEINIEAVRLTGDEQIRQSISFDRTDASGIGIQFGTYQKVIDGELTVTISDHGEVLEAWQIPMSTITDNEYHPFLFGKETLVSAGEEYELSIDAKYHSSDKMAVWTGKKEGEHYFHGNEAAEGFVVSYETLYQMRHMKTALFLWAVIVTVLLNIAYYKRINEKFCAAFLLSTISVLFFLIIPPNDVPDEEVHFLRSFEVSCGHLLSRHIDESGKGGNYLPAALLDYEDPQAELDWNDVEWFSIAGASLYAPTNYFPQALGMKLARFFTGNVRKIFYAGRLGAYLFFLFCCLLAIYWIPTGIRPLTVILLFPMTLQEGISLSADSITIGLSVLFFSFVIRLASQNRKIRTADLAVLLLIAGLLALSKIVYIVLIFLIWLIPKDKFKSRKQYRFTMIMIPAIAVIVNGIWLAVSSSYLTEFREGVDPGMQVSFVLRNLPLYIRTMIRTVWTNGSLWVITAIGSSLGWNDIPVNGLVWIGFLCAYTVELVTNGVSGLWKGAGKKAVLVFVLLSGFGLICTSLYVQWTSVGYELIEGIQGRYFIPLLPVFSLLVLANGKRTVSEKGDDRQRDGITLYMILLLLSGVAVIDVLRVSACRFL